MGRHDRPQVRNFVIAGALVGVLLLMSSAALASHQFSDVQPAAPYHDAVAWLVSRSITLGCTAGLYCPNDFVTRGQMAMFLNRLGKVLSPTYIQVNASPGALDLDLENDVCTTAPYTPAYPQRARIDGWVSLISGGTFGAQVTLKISANAGPFLPFAGYAVAGATAANQRPQVNAFAIADLIPGTSYRTTIEVHRFNGTADAIGSDCSVMVQLANRNPDGILPDSASASRGARSR